MFTRIQWRIAASYIILVALVLLGLGVYLMSYLRAQQLKALEAQLERQARLVAAHAEQQLERGEPSDLDALAKQLGRQAGTRITLVAADGTVLGDSLYDPATMDNHGTRPEVQQALAQGRGESQRRSTTQEQDLLYVAVPIERMGTPLGVARLALPLNEVRQAANQVATAVATALVVAALLVIAVSVVVARLTTEPIQALTSAARRLARGELDQTIPVTGRDEASLLAGTFNEMAARLRAQIGALEDERERLAVVLSYMANGLVITNQDGMVELTNPAAARLLQVTPEWAKGRSVMAVVRHHELGALVGAALAGAEEAGRPRLVELGLPGGRTEQRRTIQAMASPIPSVGGTGAQALLILQDVTELRQAERVRREFVANVSHELRTPVAALKALAETLADGALEDSKVARDFLHRMHVEIDGLAQLVEELFELSRIESGQVGLRRKPVDLAAVVAAAAERLRPQAERQGLKIELQLPDDRPIVAIDPERIQQVVINLVQNALKFTPSGGHVGVRVERRDGSAAVVVADTGVGIAPEAQPRLFERFYKADKARSSGGTGLGLAIAKHLVQAHGGRIWAESAGEGRGATFTFSLPLASP